MKQCNNAENFANVVCKGLQKKMRREGKVIFREAKKETNISTPKLADVVKYALAKGVHRKHC
jgi:hypothetical protein